MAKLPHPMGIRLDERSVEILDAVVERLAIQNPGLTPTRADAIRFCIASSGSVAAPIASTKPPEKRRSG